MRQQGKEEGIRGRYTAAGGGIRHQGEVHSSRARDTSAGEHRNTGRGGVLVQQAVLVLLLVPSLQPPSVCLIYREPANLVAEERGEERHEMKAREDRNR